MASDVDQAKSVIRGQGGKPEELLGLAKRLKNSSDFGLAWQVLERITGIDATHKHWKTVKQQTALCIYKDPDLPSDERLERAIEILRTCEDLNTTVDRETLGITGGAYKRMWEDDGQRSHLETSLSYYRRGHESPQPDDDGYCGINAAFMLDLLGSKAAESCDDIAAAARFGEARKIRAELVATLEPKVQNGGNWWQLATLAEATLGLGDLQKTHAWLTLAAALAPKEWELETTVRQMTTLARLQSDRKGDEGDYKRAAEDVIRRALALPEAAVKSGVIGKVGLALSGGGMRAALYHIGVLAHLAELDLLRHIDVISCVSGGSIAGAYYYLKLKLLLESTSDEEITRADYVRLVAEMADEFKAGVQRDIRTSVAASLLVNLRMIFSEAYSRTERAGQLYEEYLYQQITKSDEPILLRDLLVSPKGEKPDFKPKSDNWRRLHKVPILVLNATTLNTGHQWQFTSTFIGEPPRRRTGGIDAIYRLRRMYISGDASKNEAPGDFANVRLGVAVGSSAAVPGLFEPITLTNPYPERTVRLADGGVHDNQGLASLFEQSCKVILVSDASGQMKASDTPARGPLGVLKRSDDVLQARLREAQHSDLIARRRSGLLQGAMFIHLTKDLTGEDVDWVGCKDPATKTTPHSLTPYGVDRTIQQQLAEVRTDLDAFSDAECYALMTSGYLMTQHELNEKTVPTLAGAAVAATEPWPFLSVKAALDTSNTKENERMKALLSVSDRLAFKVWHQKAWLGWIGKALLAAVFLALAWVTYARWKEAAISITWGAIGTFVLTIIAAKIGLSALKYLNVRKTLTDVATGVGLASLGFIAARLHLHVFDPMFLSHGRWPAANVSVPGGVADSGARLSIQKPGAVPVAGLPEETREKERRFGSRGSSGPRCRPRNSEEPGNRGTTPLLHDEAVEPVLVRPVLQRVAVDHGRVVGSAGVLNLAATRLQDRPDRYTVSYTQYDLSARAPRSPGWSPISRTPAPPASATLPATATTGSSGTTSPGS